MKFFILLSFFLFQNIVFAKLTCDKSNYKEFIYNPQKTNQLIKETGKGCQLQNENLRNFDFRFSNLRKANFTDADCRGCDFRNANLFGAQFHGADVRDGDVRDVRLTNIFGFGYAKWKGTKYNKGTKTSFWINLKSYGMILICDDGKPAKFLRGCFLRE